MKTEQANFSIGNMVRFKTDFEKAETEFQAKGKLVSMMLGPGPFFVSAIIPVPPKSLKKLEHPQLLELSDFDQRPICINNEVVTISGIWLEKVKIQ